MEMLKNENKMARLKTRVDSNWTSEWKMKVKSKNA